MNGLLAVVPSGMRELDGHPSFPVVGQILTGGSDSGNPPEMIDERSEITIAENRLIMTRLYVVRLSRNGFTRPYVGIGDDGGPPLLAATTCSV